MFLNFYKKKHKNVFYINAMFGTAQRRCGLKKARQKIAIFPFFDGGDYGCS